jgi:hypothetical protein
MGMKCWHITMWDDIYETAETSRIRTLSYYGKPNKLIGEGLGFTLSQPDGLALMGTFALFEALASHGLPKQRGWLWRNGSPLDVPRIAALLRIPTEPIERALKHFSTVPMDWIEEAEFPGDGRASAGHAQPGAGREPGDGRASATRGKIEREKTTEVERERRDGGLSSEEARSRQTQQFAAARARLTTLEAVPEEERTEKNRAELRGMKALVRQIQKKQARGDFSPVEEAQ